MNFLLAKMLCSVVEKSFIVISELICLLIPLVAKKMKRKINYILVTKDGKSIVIHRLNKSLCNLSLWPFWPLLEYWPFIIMLYSSLFMLSCLRGLSSVSVVHVIVFFFLGHYEHLLIGISFSLYMFIFQWYTCDSWFWLLNLMSLLFVWLIMTSAAVFVAKCPLSEIISY